MKKLSACEKNRDRVFEMEKAGASLGQIARAVGTTGTRVGEFLRRNGVTRVFPNCSKGQNYHGWTPKKLIDKDGYVSLYAPNHPNRRKHTPYVLEHRIVMESMIGRVLLPNEVVHHRDGNKKNNSPDNLQLFSENSEHLRHELTGKCPRWSDEGRRRIRERIDLAAKKRLGQTRVPLTPDDPEYKRKKFRFVSSP